MRVVFWGTYDLGKPRNRIMLRGLRENGVDVVECHVDVWGGVEDKSQLKSRRSQFSRAARWLLAYPGLLFRYLRLPRQDAVYVGYLGHLDVLVIWPFAKLRGELVIWDAFVSLYNTIVEDRALVGRRNPIAGLIFVLDWLACRAADRVVLDTKAHAGYFVDRFGIPAEKTAAVYVGAEPEVFPRLAVQGSKSEVDPEITVLFYGQLIPLHGVETIVSAAARLSREPIKWILIGSGQEEVKLAALLHTQRLEKIEWLPWVEYEELLSWMSRSDVCLGIFGVSEKARRVIPNKVFQALSAGKPIITEDSPASRELLSESMPGIYLVPPGDPVALAEAIETFRREKGELDGVTLYEELAPVVAPSGIGKQLADVIEVALSGNAEKG